MRTIRFFDYCAGMGAFRSGFALAGGYEPIGWCEIDKTAQTAYRALYNTEGEYFHDDARTLNPNDIPDFDMLVGGLPCQSWSAAGLKLGFDDERGQLFFDYARILKARKPPLFCIENVPRITTADRGRPFGEILGHLHELGYCMEWQCIDGSAYLPQKRVRLFLIGYTDRRLSGKIFPVGLSGATPLKELVGGYFGQRVYDPSGAAVTLMSQGGGGGAKTGLYFIDMNPPPNLTETARCIIARYDGGIGKHKGVRSGVLVEESGTYPCINPTKENVRQSRRIREDGAPAFCITAQDRHGIIHKGRVRRLMPIEVFRLMGFTDSQFATVQAAVVSDAKLYKLGGNSIMVPVITEWARRLREACEKINIFESEENNNA